MYLERALFVVAPRHFGKSTTLRSMFLDRRFHTNGEIPDKSKLPDDYAISNERRLYLRLTSPHESNEDLRQFLIKTERKMPSGRWCFAGPLHPDAFKQMPDAVTTIDGFINAFEPERIRVAVLSPNHQGVDVSDFIPGRDLLADLHSIDDRVEVMSLDVRQLNRNGLVLADFFDFL
ncbi:hypothetical protein [Paraburkholderia rhynchosiae]|uniref:Uncharacterized protein n=1 Tax=Paraburkholderia rhynchosiae TaxID=487049 RepID=A0A2N7WHQ8_9BURK|nr:hypothetical protein [Paraburkholderia rhynchosiae]PMS28891.1 hypothetical protein C0Z16_20910 [Paraburkholderia rhynchosiae]CAB3665690.1 hypothetical protein LMG27174_01869 [Paraburkholderia rhynchosiae]